MMESLSWRYMTFACVFPCTHPTRSCNGGKVGSRQMNNSTQPPSPNPETVLEGTWKCL